MNFRVRELTQLFPPYTNYKDPFCLFNMQYFSKLENILDMCGGEPILDGRNRERAAREVGIEPVYVEYKGDDPLGYVISTNVDRRHLTESQRAMGAARLANMRQGERTDIEPSADLPDVKVSQSEAAEKMNVSERLLRGAKAVAEKAP